MPDSESLRVRFKSIPRDTRDRNQEFAIRTWRSISWLARSESLDAADVEGRFIAGWIAFNALYAQLDAQGMPWGDREAQRAFLVRIYNLDTRGRFRRIVSTRQKPILSIIDNPYLQEAFWAGRADAADELRANAKEAILMLQKHHQIKLWRMIIERIYMMRNQVFHGASTKGSALNRRTLQNCTCILMDFAPACIDVMLDYGIHEDWGRVCFPPRT